MKHHSSLFFDSPISPIPDLAVQFSVATMSESMLKHSYKEIFEKLSIWNVMVATKKHYNRYPTPLLHFCSRTALMSLKEPPMDYTMEPCRGCQIATSYLPINVRAI
mmetsp:Transcript_25636/g.39720  ORF Transcript_25636/g.39720 Transcript_25636/m.39720 type:complete len:106 (-) Transcript_25636:60-377(-)